MNERTSLILKLVSTHIILLPFLILISIWVTCDDSLLIIIAQTLLLILILAGYWEFFGLWFKRIYWMVSELIIVVDLILKFTSGTSVVSNWYVIVFLSIIEVFLLRELIKIAIVILKHENDFCEIEFPFRDGSYLITDGGNSKVSRLMNYHFYSVIHKKNKTNLSMLFATDIVKTNGTGNRFFPPENKDYPVFGENLISPVSGLVIKVVNNIDDNVPYSGNYPYNTGNTIVIKNNSRYLLLGHLKKDSIKVNAGDWVKSNEIIAEAGNSGYSERPHLHIQLIDSADDNFWKGTGISLQFNEKNLYKNRIVEI